MGHTLPCVILLFQAAFGFNIDPVVWKSFSSPGDDGDGFGYKVVQRQSGSGISPSLLVSAPLSQDRSGQIYKCSTESCRPMSIKVPEFAVKMSLGLTMINEPTTGKTIACGPTIPRECETITTYNGVCLEISANDNVGSPVPSSLKECPAAPAHIALTPAHIAFAHIAFLPADIAFLLDGSGSVSSDDFLQMKTFVKSVIRTLKSGDKQFAVAQFSTGTDIHYYFDSFDTSGSWESKIDNIQQQRGTTNTGAAITHVVQDVFSENRGSRQNANKFLIVITDGVSDNPAELPNAAFLAASKGIVRFAIGVGSAFNNPKELNIIATDPSKHVFQVTDFQALNDILGKLQKSIFSNEGSVKTKGSLKMEMAQEGFSAAPVPGGGFQMAAVGAFQWRGSYQEIPARGQMGDFKNFTDIDPDSYLGYTIAIARFDTISHGIGILTIVGAPRYKHMGMVMVFSSSIPILKIDPSTDPHFQIGAYFGAEVCTMDVDRNGYTDIILISAPTFMERDTEGRVYVCSLPNRRADCLSDRQSVLKGVAGERGRFGSSLAPLPDLNRDGFNDLAVGAPLENDGQGSIYIFHGDGRKTINPKYSQRIPGSSVKSGLRFFGLSISQSSFDLSGDRLDDLAVGSKGAVLLLRSKPIVKVEAQVTFSPNCKIPTNNPDCNSPLKNKAKVCFTMTRHSIVDTAQAWINYTLTLDSTRKTPDNRAYIETPKQRELFNSFTLDMAKPHCFSHEFDIEACPEDALYELINELKFTFEGVPSPDKLSPSLEQQAQTTTYHPLGFEFNCGIDDLCIDNLKVDFNFTSSTEVKIGIDELLNVTVSVENREEDSYNSRVTLTYPPGLSYRKFTMQQGRVECNSIDNENGRGKTDCTIDKPIFKSNAKAVFMVSYGIVTKSELNRTMLITAHASSGNDKHSPKSDLYQEKKIDVKYSIFLSISNPSFTFGKNYLQTPLLQTITVQNAVRACNVTVVIKVPVKLGDKDIWVNPGSVKILGCSRSKDEEPNFPDFVNKIKKSHEVDCSVATCTVFRCNVSMVKDQQEVYNISANLSSGWIEQIGLQNAEFSLISTATLDYDRDNYILDSTESKNNPPVKKATGEVYTETDLTPWIIVGIMGGLVLLALITAGLYKAGFFKSQYKQMIADQGGEGQGLEDGAAQQAEEQALQSRMSQLGAVQVIYTG